MRGSRGRARHRLHGANRPDARRRAQVGADNSVAVKTTSKARAAVSARLDAEPEWVPIVGNKPYLAWLDAETREAANAGAPGDAPACE